MTKTFSAIIFKIGINPCVDVPQPVLNVLFKQVGKAKGPIPVKGKLNGKPFIQTLVKYRGAWRLYLNTPMRRSAGIDEGDIAHVKIEYDKQPRIIPMHPRLASALAKSKRADTAFKKLSPYRQKEIVRYISNLKTEQSVNRNILLIIKHLTGRMPFAGRDL